MISVAYADLSVMLMSTLRYSLGRPEGYMPLLCKDLFLKYMPHLSPAQLVQAKNEIDENQSRERCAARAAARLVLSPANIEWNELSTRLGMEIARQAEEEEDA